MLVLPARAKINLALEVTGRRSDGFHDLQSVVVAVAWHDLVGVVISRSTEPEVGLRITGPGAGAPVPPDGRNLAHAAAVAVQSAMGFPVRIGVWLDKHLPSAAGLGGGSSDAAAVLRAAAILDAVPQAVLDTAALRLGSDVPAVLRGGRLVVSGRGEHLRSLPPGPVLHVAIAVAGASGTAATFAALTPGELRGEGRVSRVAAALAAGAHPAPADLGSGLEAAAVRCNEALGRNLARLRTEVPDGQWVLTGSGGAAFALVPSPAQATALAMRARAAGFEACATRTVG